MKIFINKFIGTQNKPGAAQADLRGGLIGKKLAQVYGGWFKDTKVIQAFVEVCTKPELLSHYPTFPNILGIGSSSGFVEEAVYKKLKDHGFLPTLTISDCIEAALKDNTNRFIQKIVCDNKKIPLSDESFDLVLARSVTHYENSLENELKVIREVRRVLKSSGFFITQTPVAHSTAAAQLNMDIHQLVHKPMHIQTAQEYINMLKMGFQVVLEIPQQALPATVTTPEFFERYNIKPSEQSALKKEIIEKILKVPKHLRPYTWANENEFGWSVHFKFFVARSNE